MRFNEKELALFAASFEPDREGLLEKKGATKGQGYKARWFRLKGNLLFYYKVDESGGWESSAPVGVIVLEGCAVKTVNIDSRPYTFSLEFQNDDARTYILVASSQSELDGWVEVLKAASYESLREMKAALQKQLSELTGTSEDVGDIGHHSKKSNFKKQSLSVSVNEERAQRLRFYCATGETSGQYTISLKCTHLTVGKDQLPPSTIMAVQCFDCHQKQLLANISRTEVVKTSCEPLYTHTPLLTIGPTCPENGFLKFEVFAMHKAPQVLASSGSEEGSSPGEFDSEEEEGVCQLQAMPESIGMAWCSIRDVMKASNGDRSIVHKLNHVSRDRNLRSGVLHITVTKLEETNSTHEAEVINTATSPGVLQSIMKSPTRSCFSFPQLNSPPNRVRVIEEKAASVFNILVPIELLKCYMKEDQQQIDVLNDIGPLNEMWTDRLQEYQAIHYESLAHYHQKVQELENLADTCDFKPYSMRQRAELQFVPCGLHIHKMRVKPHGKPESVYCFTTLGCPAHHVGGFQLDGGLQRRLQQSGRSPCFLAQWKEGRSSTVKKSLESILSIRRNVARLKDQLYMASGNRQSELMIDTVETLSKQIQELLSTMESPIVEEAIENLRSSRPWISACSSVEGVQNKRASIRRSRVIVLTCPSDWVWNGRKLVQVSLQRWQLRDSRENIEHNLQALHEAVQVAALEVVDQQHLAVAAEVKAGLATFKPTYVWSFNLIPLIQRLNQTVEGLISIAQISLSFRLMQLNSSVEGLKGLKLRRDVVFSHAVTALMTSFYITLSQLHTSAGFLRQLKEVGFLVHFESILSATDGESGVLEDMCVAVAELSTIKFQLAELVHSNSDVMFDIDITGTREDLKIRLLFSSSYFKHMPDKFLVMGVPISVTPVLFTQLVGMEEGKVDTNKCTDRTQHLLQLEEEINSFGMDAIAEYVERLSQLALDPADNQDVLKAKKILSVVKNKFATENPKPADFSTAIQQVCRLVKGGRITSCETGDMLTGLSVTTEESCILLAAQHVDKELSADTLSILRSHGVWSSHKIHS